MAPNRRQAITCTNAEPVHWRIYVALGEDELKKKAKEVAVVYKKCNFITVVFTPHVWYFE